MPGPIVPGCELWSAEPNGGHMPLTSTNFFVRDTGNTTLSFCSMFDRICCGLRGKTDKLALAIENIRRVRSPPVESTSCKRISQQIDAA